MTGAELRARRKAAGLSQAALAKLAGVGRQAVSYWEGKGDVPARQWAPKRLFAALGLTVLPDNRHRYASAGGWGLTPVPDWRAKLKTDVEVKLAALREREAARAARRRQECQELCVSGRRPGSILTALSPAWA